MAKLKCKKHDRRVVVVDDVVIHRNGDGTKCDPIGTLVIGDNQFTASIVSQFVGLGSLN